MKLLIILLLYITLYYIILLALNINQAGTSPMFPGSKGDTG